jgi:hypothetical protein
MPTRLASGLFRKEWNMTEERRERTKTKKSLFDTELDITILVSRHLEQSSGTIHDASVEYHMISDKVDAVLC